MITINDITDKNNNKKKKNVPLANVSQELSLFP